MVWLSRINRFSRESVLMVSFETRYGLWWAYRFFRSNGNGKLKSLLKACLLRKKKITKIYPSGDSVISELHSKMKARGYCRRC